MTLTAPPSVLLPPPQYGLPDHFPSWRTHQDAAVIDGITAHGNGTRFVAQSVPTGGGKSLLYVAQALLTGRRTCILTSTKGLQDQVTGDFADVGAVDVRGKGAYPCGLADAQEDWTCEDSPCMGGLRRKQTGCACPYAAALARARSAPIVITNYAMWMAVHRYGEGLGKFDLLVLDEAHDAPDQLGNQCTVELRAASVSELIGQDLPPTTWDDAAWQAWAVKWADAGQVAADRVQEDLKTQPNPQAHVYKKLRRLRELVGQLRLYGTATCTWIRERTDAGWRLDPLWPAAYAERFLFLGVPNVLLVSATLRPKTLDILGVPHGCFTTSDTHGEKQQPLSEFYEYPSTFPPDRSPVYLIPTVRMKHGMSAEDEAYWLSRIDSFLRPRMDRKGILHTVSYKRRDYVISHSEHADHMMTNQARKIWGNDPATTAARTVERFKRASPPCVLVSPSMTTGWNFPDDECRYNIIGKVPFPDATGAVMKARQDADPEYPMHLTMQVLVQEVGRSTRSDRDWSETGIFDDQARWFLHKYSHLAPRCFTRQIRKVDTLPPPPPVVRMSFEQST